MIEECERRLGRYGARAKLVCADMREWMPSETYDAVVACNALVYKEINVGECYAKYAEALRSGGLLLNSTVVEHEEGMAFTELMRNVGMADDGPTRAEEIRRFARGPGRKIAHLGEDSLAMVLPAAHHLSLMTSAGLRCVCAWHYLSQAIIAGRKSAGN
jgi:hypothetical protein